MFKNPQFDVDIDEIIEDDSDFEPLEEEVVIIDEYEEEQKFVPYTVEIGALLNCRENPEDKILEVLNKGEQYEVIAEQDGWGKINKGWIKLEFTTRL